MNKFISFEEFLQTLKKAKMVVVNGNSCNYAIIHYPINEMKSLLNWKNIEVIGTEWINFKINKNYFKVSTNSNIFQYKSFYISKHCDDEEAIAIKIV